MERRKEAVFGKGNKNRKRQNVQNPYGELRGQ